MLLIVDTFYCVAGNLQPCLRGLEQVGELASLVLVKACTAGLLRRLSLVAIHRNGRLTAAVVSVVQAVLYTTFQLGHSPYLLLLVFMFTK